jgi:hypothetical protein
MPTAGGPNTLGESNLVFAYDTGDVSNSYRGEPTTNVATGTLTPYTPYNTMTRSGQDLTITMVGGSALYLTFHNGTDYNGQTITLSGYMFKNGTPHTLPYNRANTYHTVAASKWYFDSVTGYFEIVEVCNASSIWLFHTPSGASGGDVITILDFQVEVKTHATPFVAGTRSATQGLLPVIGNSTIDLTNVSFDSSAKMVFDGSDDRILTSENIVLNGSQTFETITTISGGPQSLAGIISNHDYANTSNFGLNHISNNKIGISIGYTDGTREYDSKYTTYAATVGTPFHLVMTFDQPSNTVKLYINGALDSTFVLTKTVKFTSRPVVLGRWDYQYNYYYFNGKIPVAKIYNRALTAQEVRQNYQQHKTRFNLS